MATEITARVRKVNDGRWALTMVLKALDRRPEYENEIGTVIHRPHRQRPWEIRTTIDGRPIVGYHETLQKALVRLFELGINAWL